MKLFRNFLVFFVMSPVLFLDPTALWGWGLIGGKGGGVILLPSGQQVLLSGSAVPSSNVRVQSVALNDLGYGILGGNDGSNYYASLVSPSGVTQALTGSGLPSSLEGGSALFSCAINRAGAAIIGGSYQDDQAYVAVVSPSGVTQSITGSHLPSGAGDIYQVAINSSGRAIAGGLQGDYANPYVALISPEGVATALTGSAIPPLTDGGIDSVGIHALGGGLIGGYQGVDPYVALFSPEGVASALTGDALPLPDGEIFWVAVNDAGQGIIGGYHNNTDYYMALVSPEGVTSSLSGPGLPPTGINRIYVTAINQSGYGIVGGGTNGSSTNLPYMALVDPDGTTRVISGDLPTEGGDILSADIDDTGVAIVAGRYDESTTNYYLALISPSGIATEFRVPFFETTFLPLVTNTFLASAIPRTSGPVSALSSFFPQLGALQVLTHHTSSFEKGRSLQNRPLSSLVSALPSSEFCAENFLNFWPLEKRQKKPKKRQKTPEIQAVLLDESSWAVWASPFYQNVYLSQRNGFAAAREHIAGMISGVDRRVQDHVLLGFAGAYIWSDSRQSRGGMMQVRQGLATCYASYQHPLFLIRGSLWGGGYELEGRRETLGFIYSYTKTQGGSLAAHVELDFFTRERSESSRIEPFVSLDWLNNWQQQYRETGTSGFQLAMPEMYTGLLRTEAGLHFYEAYQSAKEQLSFEQKISYINLCPLHAQSVQTSFLGFGSPFFVSTGSDRPYNLLGIDSQIAVRVFQKKREPYGKVGLEGQLGPDMLSYALYVEAGCFF